jgi:hypothetical protein
MGLLIDRMEYNRGRYKKKERMMEKRDRREGIVLIDRGINRERD